MKRYRLVGVVLVALFAFLAVSATAAMAEEPVFLLATILVNGAAVETGELPAEQSGEIVLENTEVAAKVKCSGIFVIQIMPLSDILVTGVWFLGTTTLVGELTGTAVLCTAEKTCESGTDVELWPIHLPWLFEVELVTATGKYVALIFGTGAGAPGYHLNCLVFFLPVEEECTAKEGASGELVQGVSGIEAVGRASENGKCGTKEGVAVQEAGPNVMTSKEGPLTLSSLE